MKIDGGTLPLTRGQLDIWLSQKIRSLDTEWQGHVFVVISGMVDRDSLEQAIRHVVNETEPLRAAIFEVDGQVFQRLVDFSNIEVPYYDMTGSPDPAEEAYRLSLSVQRTPMPLAGPLFRFTLFRTRFDEYYLSVCLHHLVTDGYSSVLVVDRIATIYSAIVAGVPLPPSVLGLCVSWLAGNRNTKSPKTIEKTAPIGARIFQRKAHQIMDRRWSRTAAAIPVWPP